MGNGVESIPVIRVGSFIQRQSQEERPRSSSRLDPNVLSGATDQEHSQCRPLFGEAQGVACVRGWLEASPVPTGEGFRHALGKGQQWYEGGNLQGQQVVDAAGEASGRLLLHDPMQDHVNRSSAPRLQEVCRFEDTFGSAARTAARIRTTIEFGHLVSGCLRIWSSKRVL